MIISLAEMISCRPKDRDFPGFDSQNSQKRKLGNHGNLSKPPKHWNRRIKFQKLLKYCSNDIILKKILPPC